MRVITIIASNRHRRFTLLLLSFLFLLSIVQVQGFSTPGRDGKLSRRGDSSFRSVPKESSVEVDISQAAHSMKSCGKTAIISGVVDLALLGLKESADVKKLKLAWLASLYSFWKLSLAFNLFKVANLNQELPKEPNKDELIQGIRKLLNTMTWVWRQSAALVALATTVTIGLAWEGTIPKAKEIVFAIVVATFIGTAISSSRNTRYLSSKSSTGDASAMDSLRHDIRTNQRAMALTAAIMMVRTASMPLLAVASGPLVKALLSSIPGVITPLGIALNLRKLQGANLEAMTELTSGEGLKLEKETQQKVSRAQTAYYKEVQKALVVETVLKLVGTIAQMRK